MANSAIFKTSIGKKFFMGITGLFLISFLIIHASINAMIWYNDGGATFSHWGHFMGTNPIIRTLEIGLVIGFIVHIADGLLLWKANHEARPVKYKYNKPSANSKWYSRSMGLLGTLLLLFFVLHFSHFWVPARFTEAGLEFPVEYNGVLMHDMFGLMKVTFSELWVVIVYIVACISLFWHLLHGFQSAFRTIGVNNNRYLLLLNTIGLGFSLLVSALFALMPVAMYLKWIE